MNRNTKIAFAGYAVLFGIPILKYFLDEHNITKMTRKIDDKTIDELARLKRAAAIVHRKLERGDYVDKNVADIEAAIRNDLEFYQITGNE